MQTRAFFSNKNLEAYRNSSKIRDSIHGGALLNYPEFMFWYSQPNVRISKRNKGKRNAATENEVLHTISKTSLTQMANDVCENHIDVQYGISAILNLNFEKFDLLVALAPDHEKLKLEETTVAPKTSLKNKTKHILGFIIVERGECKMFPDSYVINLICTRSKVEYKKYGRNVSSERERLRGAILLGAYLFCAKKLKQGMGLLELSDGYKNVKGFFSYSKMGFIRDVSLFDRKCFKDYANLPMSVDLTRYSYEQIINYASGVDKLVDIEDESGLIELVPKTPRQEDIQKQVAALSNLTYQIDYILAGEYALHPRLDAYEIDFLGELEERLNDRAADDDQFQDITVDDYLHFINGVKQQLIDTFKTTAVPTRNRTRSSMKAGSNKTRKQFM